MAKPISEKKRKAATRNIRNWEFKQTMTNFSLGFVAGASIIFAVWVLSV